MTLSPETLATFAVVHLLAAATPGPNFFLVTGLATSSSRRHALLAAGGILASVAVWLSATVAGLGIILDRQPVIYEALRLVGAGYLIWLGFRMARNSLMKPENGNDSGTTLGASCYGAFLRGFTVNITNPKTVAYFSSLFAVFVPNSASTAALLEIVSAALVVSCAWWVFVALIFSTKKVQHVFSKIRRPVEFIAGGAFLAFGLRLATQRVS